MYSLAIVDDYFVVELTMLESPCRQVYTISERDCNGESYDRYIIISNHNIIPAEHLFIADRLQITYCISDSLHYHLKALPYIDTVRARGTLLLVMPHLNVQ